METSRGLDHGVLYIMIVGFHHIQGPVVEYIYPHIDQCMSLLPERWKLLPFYAIPDGAHQHVESWSGFHLPAISSSHPYTIFGISCCRQIDIRVLSSIPKDTVRNSILKSIVLLTKDLIYLSSIKEQLSLLCKSWFDQGLFTDYTMIKNFYLQLDTNPMSISNRNTNLSFLIEKFGKKTLTIIKLFLLEKRIIFFSEYDSDILVVLLYSIASIFPGMFSSLSCMEAFSIKPKDSLNSFPLPLLDKATLFQPYFPLTELSNTFPITGYQYQSILLGTTNRMLQEHPQLDLDVVVNITSGSISIKNETLIPILTLTRWDKRFIKTVCYHHSLAITSYDELDKIHLQKELFLIDAFRTYFVTLLRAYNYYLHDFKSSFSHKHEYSLPILMSDYGQEWFLEWCRTKAMNRWHMSKSDQIDETLSEIVEQIDKGSRNNSNTCDDPLNSTKYQIMKRSIELSENENVIQEIQEAIYTDIITSSLQPNLQKFKEQHFRDQELKRTMCISTCPLHPGRGTSFTVSSEESTSHTSVIEHPRKGASINGLYSVTEAYQRYKTSSKQYVITSYRNDSDTSHQHSSSKDIPNNNQHKLLRFVKGIFRKKQ